MLQAISTSTINVPVPSSVHSRSEEAAPVARTIKREASIFFIASYHREASRKTLLMWRRCYTRQTCDRLSMHLLGHMSSSGAWQKSLLALFHFLVSKLKVLNLRLLEERV
jgi:hypothetical protein